MANSYEQGLAGVPQLLVSTAASGLEQAAKWNAVSKHELSVEVVSMCGVKCVLKLLVALTDCSHKHVAIATQPPAGWKPAS